MWQVIIKYLIQVQFAPVEILGKRRTGHNLENNNKERRSNESLMAFKEL